MTDNAAPKNRYSVDFDALEKAEHDQLEEFTRGKDPVASPKARWFAVFIGLLLIAGCVIAARDLLIRHDHVTGEEFIAPALNWLDGLDITGFAIPVAVVAGIIALLLLILVVAPRRRTHVAVSPMWLRPVDMARVATATARSVQGVINAHSVSTRKKITVTAVPALDEAHTDLEALKADIEQALTRTLGDEEARGGVALKIKINNQPGANQR
ncbi:MAG TPA: hypothetical protein H9867_08340 [Candidatus Corynebacterium gallistercoris]|uniref:DUF6286 domain-containing protein n=1 Tax=Candidatus Corynebacterium gallistercoris TaxID=2838530 RepID=A0A9D1RY58_9CORY|nr:hypothetical protein [Candidatus Corynebacterium gallistercoris]